MGGQDSDSLRSLPETFPVFNKVYLGGSDNSSYFCR